MKEPTKKIFTSGAPFATVGSLATELTSPMSTQPDIKAIGKMTMFLTLSPFPIILLILLD
jgi:hypothetical protein